MTSSWQKNAIIYQIYPRSFNDSNGDGIGDLHGIIEKIDYLVALGITAVWISPVYASPMLDMGYDIADFKKIDPIFGTLSDFDELVTKLHEKDIKVVMDYIPNHTSEKHPWFEQARSSKKNPKRDWYMWADPRPDGSPPNNWLSNFGGSAWTLDTATNQYYYHQFYSEQPDLNWRNPEVVKEMLDVLRFWMQHGVDGFRVDAVYLLFENQQLLDEPQNPEYIPGKNPTADSLKHIYTEGLPETIAMMKAMTEVIKSVNTDSFMVSEAYVGLEQLKKQLDTIGWEYYTPFNFQFISLPWEAAKQKLFIDAYDKELKEHFIPTYVLGNHDRHRIVTRIGEKQARIAAMALLTLRGIAFIYNGEELGMPDTPIPLEKITDRYDAEHPELGLGRDPERTPMQWDTSENAGFTKGHPWLPIHENYQLVNVTSENNDPTSFLSLYKALIKCKKENDTLCDGWYTPLPSPTEGVFAFIRETDNAKLLVLLNFTHENKQCSMEYKNAALILSATLTRTPGEKIDLSNFTLPADEGFVITI